jgi:hypothetical protein
MPRSTATVDREHRAEALVANPLEPGGREPGSEDARVRLRLSTRRPGSAVPRSASQASAGAGPEPCSDRCATSRMLVLVGRDGDSDKRVGVTERYIRAAVHHDVGVSRVGRSSGRRSDRAGGGGVSGRGVGNAARGRSVGSVAVRSRRAAGGGSRGRVGRGRRAGRFAVGRSGGRGAGRAARGGVAARRVGGVRSGGARSGRAGVRRGAGRSAGSTDRGGRGRGSPTFRGVHGGGGGRVRTAGGTGGGRFGGSGRPAAGSRGGVGAGVRGRGVAGPAIGRPDVGAGWSRGGGSAGSGAGGVGVETIRIGSRCGILGGGAVRVGRAAVGRARFACRSGSGAGRVGADGRSGGSGRRRAAGPDGGGRGGSYRGAGVGVRCGAAGQHRGPAAVTGVRNVPSITYRHIKQEAAGCVTTVARRRARGGVGAGVSNQSRYRRPGLLR